MSSNSTQHLPTLVRSRRLIARYLPFALIALAVIPLLIPTSCPRWALMWIVAGSIYAACKLLTLSFSAVATTAKRRLMYLLSWPGLDANAFLDTRRQVPRAQLIEWVSGFGCLFLGTVAFFALPRFIPSSPIVAGWFGMTGIVLCLHFGLFKILSCVFRRQGIGVRPLMNAPIASTSISDFWRHRWNTAFRDITHQFVFRPICKRFGPRLGVAAGFTISGLVHDLVISFPAGAGYGLPTLYFLIQLLAVLVERSKMGRRIELSRGIRGWLYTASVLIIPIPLLFHRHFVTEVIVPFMQAMGAI